MRRASVLAALSALALAYPASAQDDLRAGFEGALRGCETWVLYPASWDQGIGPLLAGMALGDKVGQVTEIADQAQPPEALRLGNHYWRINSTSDSGYILVTSDTLPMCHITGGGAADLQPVVASVLASPEFDSRWTKEDTGMRDDIFTTTFRNVEDGNFTIVVSRTDRPGGRRDRVQVVATAIYELDN